MKIFFVHQQQLLILPVLLLLQRHVHASRAQPKSQEEDTALLDVVAIGVGGNEGDVFHESDTDTHVYEYVEESDFDRNGDEERRLDGNTTVAPVTKPYVPPSTNAAIPGQIDPELIQQQLPPDAIGPFRMRMAWHKNSCWQGSCKHELDWCMQCEGFECNDGDLLWIELCRNIDQQLFVWTPVDNEDTFTAEPDEEVEGGPFNADKKKKRKLQLNLLQHLEDFNFHETADEENGEDATSVAPTNANRPSASPTKLSAHNEHWQTPSETNIQSFGDLHAIEEVEQPEKLVTTTAPMEEWYFPLLTDSPTSSSSWVSTSVPTAPSTSTQPSDFPSELPTPLASEAPSASPSTVNPTLLPSDAPAISHRPSMAPTTARPSDFPSSILTETPTTMPTVAHWKGPNTQLGTFQVADISKNLWYVCSRHFLLFL